MESAFTITLAFFMGAFPTAYLLGRRLKAIDMRAVGSQNPGALNAYRQLGKKVGLLVLVVDTGKGALAIFVGQRLGVPDVVLYVSALVATVGHNFSPFLRFRGGKGAATVLGISALMLWQITAITVGVGGVLFAATRRPVWSLTGVFLLLNALTIGTSQPLGMVLLCLALSFIVAGTHLVRQHPQLIPALRQRQWHRFMRVE
jgi:glycerol-3-phosphate acyltransferase PlsY